MNFIRYIFAYLEARREAKKFNLMDPHHYAKRAAEMALWPRMPEPTRDSDLQVSP